MYIYFRDRSADQKTEQIHDFFDKNPEKQFIALRNTASGLHGLSRYYFSCRCARIINILPKDWICYLYLSKRF